MPDRYDPVPDLAALVWAAVYFDRSTACRAEALLPLLGIGGNDSAGTAAIEAGLRRTLGPALDREQLGTVLSALEDAADYRREHRDGDCSDCDALPEGKLCGDHEVDEAVASMYDLLHDELQERQGRGGEKAADGTSAPDLADRVADVLSEAGYTDARKVFPGGFLITGGPGYATTGSVIVSVPWTDATDAERRRLLARFALALRDGGLYVTARAHYLEVRAMPGEAREW